MLGVGIILLCNIMCNESVMPLFFLCMLYKHDLTTDPQNMCLPKPPKITSALDSCRIIISYSKKCMI